MREVEKKRIGHLRIIHEEHESQTFSHINPYMQIRMIQQFSEQFKVSLKLKNEYDEEGRERDNSLSKEIVNPMRRKKSHEKCKHRKCCAAQWKEFRMSFGRKNKVFKDGCHAIEELFFEFFTL